MNVPNHEKKPFRDMTADEMKEIIMQRNACQAFIAGNWVHVLDDNLICINVAYRTKPRQLIIPWDVIKPEYKWAAMDENGCIYFFINKPEIERTAWFGGKSCISVLLNIDTTGIDWRESLVQRPE